MMKAINPFVVSGTIPHEYFCDRVNESEQLEKAVKFNYKGTTAAGASIEKAYYGVQPEEAQLKADGIATVTSTDIDRSGRGYIETKLDIVRDWLKTAWEIDLDKLREIVQRRSDNVTMLDLQTLN